MAPLQFGILMIDYQAIDVVGPLDILNCSSKKMIESMEQIRPPHVPKGLASRGIDIEFHHINETMDPIVITGNIHVTPTTTCDGCPPLDCLLVGGPGDFNMAPRFAKFVRDHVAAGKTLFTTCTGGLVVASTGVLDGKSATTNHECISIGTKMFPQVNWTIEKQWVVDGEIWTAGGACAGMDMMAHWVKENYGEDVALSAFAALDFEPRDQDGKMVLPPQHWKAVHSTAQA